MALIIKGKMPVGKGCDECEFQTSRCEQLDACTCFLFNGCIHNFHNERHKDCPIIGEIPDRHGRLISESDIASLIIADIQRLETTDEYTNREKELVREVYQSCLYKLGITPTIVEATE